MIDAKRLAEMMAPEKIRDLADFLDGLCTKVAGFESDALDCAAAVLREVAEEREPTRLKTVTDLMEELAAQVDATMPTSRESAEWRRAYSGRLHQHHMQSMRRVEATIDTLIGGHVDPCTVCRREPRTCNTCRFK